MQSQVSKLKFCISMISLLVSVPAFSDEYSRDGYGMVRCSTTSNGYNFSDESLDRYLARTQATNHCRSSSATNNDECNANVTCSDVPTRPMIMCITSSNGYSFRDESRDSVIAKRQAVAQCVASSAANNEECNANVMCEGGGQVRPQRPRPGVEACTVKRFDPSGMFIKSYIGTGFRSEACDVARVSCEREIKGSQFCE